MSTIKDQVNETLTKLETGLNYVGYIPLASSFSGPLRALYGKFEIISAVVLGAIEVIASLFKSNNEERRAGFKKGFQLFKTYAPHGISNIFRGFIESFPFLSLVTCLPYDLMGYRFAYPDPISALENFRCQRCQR